MAFEKGKPRPANAGRRKGTPNKVASALKKELAAAGNDMLAFLMAVAKDETQPIERRVHAAVNVLPYQHPKLSTVTSTATVTQTLLGSDGKPVVPRLIIECYAEDTPPSEANDSVPKSRH